MLEQSRENHLEKLRLTTSKLNESNKLSINVN